jgi:hypothetical protein
VRHLLWRGTLAVLFAVPGVRVAHAQTAAEPTIVFTVYAGAVTGHGLWAIDRQPLCQFAGNPGSCTGVYDTVSIARDVGSSLSAGLAMTYFPRPALGVQFDVSFLGLPLEDRCVPIAVPSGSNQALCQSIPANSPGGSALSFELGVIARPPAGSSPLRPYARLGVGLLTHTESTVEVDGSYGSTQGTKIIITDDNPYHTSASLFGGVGLVANLSPGYLLRLEARDVYAKLARVTGPANDLGVAPTNTRSFHHIALSLGLGIVLEQKRGRRY